MLASHIVDCYYVCVCRERYRDLIEAADTIQEMESSASGVSDEVANVQKLCSSLQHRGLIGFRTASLQHKLVVVFSELTYVCAYGCVPLLFMLSLSLLFSVFKNRVILRSKSSFIKIIIYILLQLSQAALI